MTTDDVRQGAFEMLRDTLSAEDGAGSDLAVFRLEEDGEWAEVQGFLDMGHLVSEVVSWASEKADREPSDGTQVYVGVQDIAVTYDECTGDLRVRFRHGDYERTVEASCAPPTITDRFLDEPGVGRGPIEPVHVQIAARKGGKHSALADMIVERANAKGVRVEFVTPDQEPSDAEVLAALNARELSVRERSGSARYFNPAPDLSLFDEGTVADTRAALIAAQEVRRAD